MHQLHHIFTLDLAAVPYAVGHTHRMNLQSGLAGIGGSVDGFGGIFAQVDTDEFVDTFVLLFVDHAPKQFAIKIAHQMFDLSIRCQPKLQQVARHDFVLVEIPGHGLPFVFGAAFVLLAQRLGDQARDLFQCQLHLIPVAVGGC